MNKKTYVIPLVFLILISMVTSYALASTGDTVLLEPSQPEPLESITFTVEPLDSQNTTAVFVEIQECNGNTGICYGFSNLTAVPANDDLYLADFTLEHSDATYITYQVITYGPSIGFVQGDLIEVTLKTGGGGGGDGDSTMLYYFLGAVAVVVVLGIVLIFFVLKK